MVIQEYVIKLTSGEKVIASEPFDMTGPKTLINRYEKAAPETVFRIGDSINGVCYFKAKDIVSIRTGDVKEVSDGLFQLLTSLS